MFGENFWNEESAVYLCSCISELCLQTDDILWDILSFLDTDLFSLEGSLGICADSLNEWKSFFHGWNSTYLIWAT